LPEAFRLLPEADAQKIDERVKGLRTAMAGKDPETIRQSAYLLDQATVKLAELIVREAVVQNSPGSQKK
jgi:hypothetical protein